MRPEISFAMPGTTSDNIWDAAIALDQQRRLGMAVAGAGVAHNWDKETSLLFVGSKGAGDGEGSWSERDTMRNHVYLRVFAVAPLAS